MYVNPNTVIRILKDCPLDNTYDHTIHFVSETAQINYFTGLTKYTLSSQSYQRVRRGFMRVEIKSENLYDCNYLMFQNTAFGNKWFYAFIKSVEYINNITSEIEFEIDVMQTWYFNYELGECFVEREHSITDNLFENLVPENLDLGDDYVCNGVDAFDLNNMSVCMLASPSKGYAVTGKTINNIYTPLHLIAGVPSTDPASIDSLVKEYVDDGQEDRIITMYQYPSFLGDASTTGVKSTDKLISKNTTKIDGHEPKNKKLFSYPYNFLLVSNNAGQTATFKWENWSTPNAPFKIAGAFVSMPAVMCYPTSHRGIKDDYDSGLVLNSFPQCPWVGDTFKAWWAQNKASTVTSISASVASAGSAAIMSGFNPLVVGASIVGVANRVASTLAKVEDLKNTPPQVHGHAQTESLNAGMGRVEFSFYKLSIKKQFAKIIDNYFTMYGYATRRVKIPNTAVRPHWTYTKTTGCVATGSVPADDMKQICGIYDKGITFWRNGANVGNYSLDNTVGGEAISE